MATIPKPTPAELELLQAIWPLGPATAKQVHEAMLAEKPDLAYGAVLRLMQIMHSKGLLIRDERQRSHIYAAAVAREAMQGNMLQDLLQRAFAGSAKALRRMMRAAATARDSGRSILIFPEGTRVPPGEQPPLQAGFAGLYRQLGLPVIPIALDSGFVSPRRSFLKRPGTVTVLIGDPIPPKLPREEVEARVHEAINALERNPAAR